MAGALLRGGVRRFPWLCNVLLYGGLFAAGDAAQQLWRRRRRGQPPDWAQTRRVALVAFAFHGNFSYVWLRALERALPGRRPPAVLGKVLCDQLLGAPVAVLAFYTGECRGRPGTAIWGRPESPGPRTLGEVSARAPAAPEKPVRGCAVLRQRARCGRPPAGALPAQGLGRRRRRRSQSRARSWGAAGERPGSSGRGVLSPSGCAGQPGAPPRALGRLGGFRASGGGCRAAAESDLGLGWAGSFSLVARDSKRLTTIVRSASAGIALLSSRRQPSRFQTTN